jgi:multiple antibiotic resistance protein
VTFLALRFAGVLQRVIRPTGVLLLARVAGLILAAVAVQMMADSVIEFARQV